MAAYCELCYDSRRMVRQLYYYPNYEPAGDYIERILRKRRAIWEADYLSKVSPTNGKKDHKWREKYGRPTEPDLTDMPELPDEWVVASIDQLTTHITSGSRDWTKYYGSGSGTFIMAQNVRPGLLDLSFRQAVNPPQDNRDRARSQIELGDLLVTIVGANTGDVCPVQIPLPEHYVCQSVALMRPVDSAMTPFLNLYMMSQEHGQRQYARYIYGQGRPHLSFDQLRMTAVAIPPLAEQQEIVRRVEALFKTADALEARYRTAKAHVDKLAQSILARAFRGELVTTEAELARQEGRDYEPASVLLERIRQERAQQATSTKPTPKQRRAASTAASLTKLFI
jgi:type I restriction enzyme, S subunit